VNNVIITKQKPSRLERPDGFLYKR